LFPLILDDLDSLTWIRNIKWTLIKIRHGKLSTLIAYQLPVGNSYKIIGEPAIGDAIIE